MAGDKSEIHVEFVDGKPVIRHMAGKLPLKAREHIMHLLDDDEIDFKETKDTEQDKLDKKQKADIERVSSDKPSDVLEISPPYLRQDAGKAGEKEIVSGPQRIIPSQMAGHPGVNQAISGATSLNRYTRFGDKDTHIKNPGRTEPIMDVLVRDAEKELEERKPEVNPVVTFGEEVTRNDMEVLGLIKKEIYEAAHNHDFKKLKSLKDKYLKLKKKFIDHLDAPEIKKVEEDAQDAAQERIDDLEQKKAQEETDTSIGQGMSPEGMPPEGMPSEGMPPEGMPPEGMPPEGMPPEGMPPEGGGGLDYHSIIDMLQDELKRRHSPEVNKAIFDPIDNSYIIFGDLNLIKAFDLHMGSMASGAKHVDVSAAHKNIVNRGGPGSSPRGGKYLWRWWNGDHWRYKYSDEPANFHGHGQEAQQAMARGYDIQMRSGHLTDENGNPVHSDVTPGAYEPRHTLPHSIDLHPDLAKHMLNEDKSLKSISEGIKSAEDAEDEHVVEALKDILTNRKRYALRHHEDHFDNPADAKRAAEIHKEAQEALKNQDMDKVQELRKEFDKLAHVRLAGTQHKDTPFANDMYAASMKLHEESDPASTYWVEDAFDGKNGKMLFQHTDDPNKLNARHFSDHEIEEFNKIAQEYKKLDIDDLQRFIEEDENLGDTKTVALLRKKLEEVKKDPYTFGSPGFFTTFSQNPEQLSPNHKPVNRLFHSGLNEEAHYYIDDNGNKQLVKHGPITLASQKEEDSYNNAVKKLKEAGDDPEKRRQALAALTEKATPRVWSYLKQQGDITDKERELKQAYAKEPGKLSKPSYSMDLNQYADYHTAHHDDRHSEKLNLANIDPNFLPRSKATIHHDDQGKPIAAIIHKPWAKEEKAGVDYRETPEGKIEEVPRTVIRKYKVESLDRNPQISREVAPPHKKFDVVAELQQKHSSRDFHSPYEAEKAIGWLKYQRMGEEVNKTGTPDSQNGYKWFHPFKHLSEIDYHVEPKKKLAAHGRQYEIHYHPGDDPNKPGRPAKSIGARKPENLRLAKMDENGRLIIKNGQVQTYAAHPDHESIVYKLDTGKIPYTYHPPRNVPENERFDAEGNPKKDIPGWDWLKQKPVHQLVPKLTAADLHELYEHPAVKDAAQVGAYYLNKYFPLKYQDKETKKTDALADVIELLPAALTITYAPGESGTITRGFTPTLGNLAQYMTHAFAHPERASGFLYEFVDFEDKRGKPAMKQFWQLAKDDPATFLSILASAKFDQNRPDKDGKQREFGDAARENYVESMVPDKVNKAAFTPFQNKYYELLQRHDQLKETDPSSSKLADVNKELNRILSKVPKDDTKAIAEINEANLYHLAVKSRDYSKQDLEENPVIEIAPMLYKNEREKTKVHFHNDAKLEKIKDPERKKTKLAIYNTVKTVIPHAISRLKNTLTEADKEVGRIDREGLDLVGKALVDQYTYRSYNDPLRIEIYGKPYSNDELAIRYHLHPMMSAARDRGIPLDDYIPTFVLLRQAMPEATMDKVKEVAMTLFKTAEDALRDEKLM